MKKYQSKFQETSTRTHEEIDEFFSQNKKFKSASYHNESGSEVCRLYNVIFHASRIYGWVLTKGNDYILIDIEHIKNFENAKQVIIEYENGSMWLLNI